KARRPPRDRSALPSAEEVAATTSRSVSRVAALGWRTRWVMLCRMAMLPILACQAIQRRRPVVRSQPRLSGARVPFARGSAAEQAIGVAQRLGQLEVAVIVADQ